MTNELHAINRLLERARTQAYLGQEPKQTGRLLDDIHYLLNSVIDTVNGEPFDDNRFRAYLRQIEGEYEGVHGILAGYENAPVGTISGKA